MLLDENLSMDRRLQIAKEFCSASKCCLDTRYSLRLRTIMQAGCRVACACARASLPLFLSLGVGVGVAVGVGVGVFA